MDYIEYWMLLDARAKVYECWREDECGRGDECSGDMEEEVVVMTDWQTTKTIRSMGYEHQMNNNQTIINTTKSIN